MNHAAVAFFRELHKVADRNVLAADLHDARATVVAQVQNGIHTVLGLQPFLDRDPKFLTRRGRAVDEGHVPLRAEKLQHGDETPPTDESLFPISLDTQDAVTIHRW